MNKQGEAPESRDDEDNLDFKLDNFSDGADEGYENTEPEDKKAG